MSTKNLINNKSIEAADEFLPENEINELKKIFIADNSNSNAKIERPIYDSFIKLKNNLLDLNSFQMTKVFKMYILSKLSKQSTKYPKMLTFQIIHNVSLALLIAASVSLPKRYMLKVLFGFSIIVINFKIVERYICMKSLEQMALSDDMTSSEQQARNILEYKYRIQGTGYNKHVEITDQVKQMLQKIDEKTQKYFKMKKIAALL